MSDGLIGWRSVRLGEVATLKQGKVLQQALMRGGAVPVFGANGIIGWHDQPTHDDSAVVVGCRGTCGAVHMTPARAFITNNAMVISPDETIDNDYLYFALLASDLSQAVTGTSQPQITKGRLSALELLTPPLPEQQTIAHVLRTVQRAQDDNQQVLAATHELKNAFLHHLFAYGPVSVADIRSVPTVETEAGIVRGNWASVPIGQLASRLKAGGTPRRSDSSLWGGEIPFAKIEDITGCGGRLTDTAERITEAGLQQSSAWVVPVGSVLLTMYATIGIPAINYIPVATNQAIIAIIPKAGVSSEYLLFALQRFGPALVRLNVQSTQKNISKTIVDKFPLPLPDVNEQQVISKMLEAVDRKIRAERNRRQALDALFASLLHGLLTGKRRVSSTLVDHVAEASA